LMPTNIKLSSSGFRLRIQKYLAVLGWFHRDTYLEQQQTEKIEAVEPVEIAFPEFYLSV
jgi:hypothetical protein